MFLRKYLPRKHAVLLVNADRERVRVYMDSTKGVVVDEYKGQKMGKEELDFIDQHSLPMIRFKFANLESWEKELPLTKVGNDTNYQFPWQEGRQAPVAVLASMLSKSDCEIRNIIPMALSPEMLVKPDSKNKILNLSMVLGADLEDFENRMAKAVLKTKDKDPSSSDPNAPLGIVIHGIEKKIEELTRRADELLKNFGEARDERQFLMSGGGDAGAIAMISSELAFLAQARNHASLMNISVKDGKLTKGQALASLSTAVSSLEAEYRKKALQVGTDIDITAIEYYSKHVRTNLITSTRQYNEPASAKKKQDLIVPL